MNHQKLSAFKSVRSIVSVSLFSLAVGLLSTACGSSQAALESADAQTAANTQAIATNTAAEPKATVPDAKIAPADADVKNEYDTSEIDFSDACIRNDCEFSVSPRLLSSEQLNTIHGEISPDEAIIRDQSFAITLPYIGAAEFIATESKADRLSLRLRTDRNEYQDIYQPRNPWKLWSVKAVAFEDIHQDGDGPDIIVIAEYVTGIGPDGAQPFPVASISFNRGDDTFQNDEAVNYALSDRNASTVSEVIEIARAEGLVRGLQYREGPP